MLAERAEALARELLPDGRREGAEWTAPSRVGASQRSLSVRISGDRRGVWGDFSAGVFGDGLDLVVHVMGGSKADAMGWARRWLGLGDDVGGARPAPVPRPVQAQNREPTPEEERRRRQAHALFLEAQPGLTGTPVEAYLQGRGLPLSGLAAPPRALRFHPAVWSADRGANLPCMIACIVAPEHGFRAVHRTWLEHRQGAWRKADLARPKMVLGAYAGGLIPIARGASRKPLHAAPEGDVIVLAEGIESAIASAVLAPEWRVCAAVSVTNFARIMLPDTIRTVVLASDGDAPDSPAAAALHKAAARFLQEGREVRIARWPEGDAADALAAAEMETL